MATPMLSGNPTAAIQRRQDDTSRANTDGSLSFETTADLALSGSHVQKYTNATPLDIRLVLRLQIGRERGDKKEPGRESAQEQVVDDQNAPFDFWHGVSPRSSNRFAAHCPSGASSRGTRESPASAAAL